MIPRVALPWLSMSAARPAADRHLSTPETAVSGRFQAIRPLQCPYLPTPIRTFDPGGSPRHHTCTRVSDWPGALRNPCTSDRRDPYIPQKRPFSPAAPPLRCYQPSSHRVHHRPSRSSKYDEGPRGLTAPSARCIDDSRGQNLIRPVGRPPEAANTPRFCCNRLCRVTCQT